MKVAIKYCGSCNPNIDLPRLARHLASLAGSLDFVLVSPEEDGVDTVVVLNGCRQACGDNMEILPPRVHRVSVAGESVEGQVIAEKFLPQAIEQALRGCMERHRAQRFRRAV